MTAEDRIGTHTRRFLVYTSRSNLFSVNAGVCLDTSGLPWKHNIHTLPTTMVEDLERADVLLSTKHSI